MAVKVKTKKVEVKEGDGIVLYDVKELVLEKRKFPSGKQIREACLSYFALYRTSSGRDKKGIIEFNQEGLNKISDVGMFNAIGITRQRWNAWKGSKDVHKSKKTLREAIDYIEQVLEQVDQERLSTRGNVGDVFRMKAKHSWQKEDGKKSKALQDVSSDRVAAILSRMQK